MAAAARSARLLVAPVNESGVLPHRCGRTPLSLNLASPPKVDKRIISGAGLRVIGTGAPGAGRQAGRQAGRRAGAGAGSTGPRWWMRTRDAGGAGRLAGWHG